MPQGRQIRGGQGGLAPPPQCWLRGTFCPQYFGNLEFFSNFMFKSHFEGFWLGVGSREFPTGNSREIPVKCHSRSREFFRKFPGKFEKTLFLKALLFTLTSAPDTTTPYGIGEFGQNHLTWSRIGTVKKRPKTIICDFSENGSKKYPVISG